MRWIKVILRAWFISLPIDHISNTNCQENDEYRQVLPFFGGVQRFFKVNISPSSSFFNFLLRKILCRELKCYSPALVSESRSAFVWVVNEAGISHNDFNIKCNDQFSLLRAQRPQSVSQSGLGRWERKAPLVLGNDRVAANRLKYNVAKGVWKETTESQIGNRSWGFPRGFSGLGILRPVL